MNVVLWHKKSPTKEEQAAIARRLMNKNIKSGSNVIKVEFRKKKNDDLRRHK